GPDPRLGGRRRRRHPFNHDRVVTSWLDHAKFFDGHFFDAPGGAQGLDFQPETTPDLFLCRFLVMQLLHHIAVMDELEMLPGREQEHEDQHSTYCRRAPELPMPCFVELTHNRVVPDVLLD